MPPQKSPVVELRLPDFSNVFKREAKPLPMCDSAGLPYTDQAQISLLRGEYEEAAIHGGQEAVEKCFNLTWALVHSHKKEDIKHGLALAEAMLSSDDAERRELLYIKAVGQYRLKEHIAARKTLKGTLEEFPESRQARDLLDNVETEIVKDGVVGIGAAVGVMGIIATIVVAASKKR